MTIEASRTCLIAAVALGLFACTPTPPSGSSTTDGASTTSTTSTSTTTETETGEPGETETETETGEPPLEDVPPLACDPWAQDCPAGEKCVPYASSGSNWDAHKCVPVLGEQAPGEPCSYAGRAEATDNCDASSYCFDVQEVDGEMLGTCFPLCTGSPKDPMCPPGYACSISGDSVINLCLYLCDPLAQDCPAGEACYWNNEFNCIPTTEDIPLGEPCGFLNDCAPGLMCIMTEALPDCADAYCCASFCSLAAGDGPCEAQVPGTVCVPFFQEGETPPEYEDVGVCATPPPWP